MKIDRSAFLLLTASIAGAACSAASPPPADGSDQAVTENSCVDGNKPAAKAPFEEGFCFDLAVSNDGPTREGSNIAFFDFIDEHCRAYHDTMKPAIGAKTQECLAGAKVKGKEFDALKMYDCGRQALKSACADPKAQAACQTMSAPLKLTPQATDTFVRACTSLTSGLEANGRAQISDCVGQAAQGDELAKIFSNDPAALVDSCVEGLSQAPPAAGQCIPNDNDATVVIDPTFCADLGKRAAFAQPFVESHCNMYGAVFKSGAAAQVRKCLDAAKDVNNDIYDCGRDALRAVCSDASADDACKQIVSAVVSKPGHEKDNAGGRLTKQCRSFLSGLKDSGRNQMVACAKGDPFFDLYSCVEGLQAK